MRKNKREREAKVYDKSMCRNAGPVRDGKTNNIETVNKLKTNGK